MNIVPPRITQVVNDSKLTVLRGNTYPLARPEFDRGAAPDSLPMERMLLVLKRSPEQEAALERFMAEQQDKSSPNYHHWLTPREFGRQFGPSGQDIQTISLWLASHGFQLGNVSNGRTLIEFTGNAAEVQDAFHTAIHKYVLPSGEEHWANASDPAIPAALAPVVTGIRSLHNFFPKPMSHVVTANARSAAAGGAKSASPLYTFPAGCTVSNSNPNLVCQFALGPADFATIYNVAPLWNAGIDGTGQTIAVVTDSNINVQDVRDFRSIFGLPAKDPNIIVNGADPGKTSDEVEAILDAEWSGAVARNANIDLVVSASTNTSFGGDLSAEYIIDFPNYPSNTKTSTGLAPILSMSFGACEFSMGTAGNQFYDAEWQQAAAEGITVIVSSGDNGSAGCDVPFPAPANCGFSGSLVVQLAQCGLQVNGLASTPFNVAVGGTEFNDILNPLKFWSTGNTPGTQASALSYVPEMTYNDSCTDFVVYQFFSFASAELACNDTNNVQPNGFVVAVGGSGGASNCTTSDFNTSNGTGNLSSCAGGYPKPPWQTALTRADNSRDLPDISLFAGDGTISGSSYVVCERDFSGINNAPCSLTGGAFLNAGGTSVSAQVFAGIMALVDQTYESSQGLVNPLLYNLAAQQSPSNCNASTPAAGCIFNDVTVGTISMPCVANSPNCLVTNPPYPIGVLTGFDAGAGYDLATGLGSVNAANLANASGWATTTSGDDFTLTLSAPSVTISRGGSGAVTLTITGHNGYAGTIDFASASCSGLPFGASCSFSPPSVTGSGSTTITISTTAPSMLTPISGRERIGWPPAGATLALACAFCLGFLWIAFRHRPRRWSAALALAAFAVVAMDVGCSGGGGGGAGGGNPGTPLGTTAVVITAKTSAGPAIQRSLGLTIIVK